MIDSGAPTNRPILITSPAGRREFAPPHGGGKEKTRLPTRQRQAQRLSSRFNDLAQALEHDRVTAQTSLPATDPELVLVFETRGKVAEVFDAAKKVGLELLIEVEDEFEPDEDFQKGTVKPADVPGFLHVALTNATAMQQLLQLWEMWSRDEPLVGFGGKNSGLASLFTHLKDVRPWGPEDRIRSTGLAEAIEQRINDGIADVPIEVQLWYYDAAERRQQSETDMRAAIENVGGQVVLAASHEDSATTVCRAWYPLTPSVLCSIRPPKRSSSYEARTSSFSDRAGNRSSRRQTFNRASPCRTGRRCRPATRPSRCLMGFR